MSDVPEPGGTPEDPVERMDPPRPKRGAIPTPKSEIEKATPYVPDARDADEDEER